MVLIIAILNDGTIMTLSLDRVLPSMTPDHLDLAEIFSYAVAYGLYLTLSTIVLYIVSLLRRGPLLRAPLTLTSSPSPHLLASADFLSV